MRTERENTLQTGTWRGCRQAGERPVHTGGDHLGQDQERAVQPGRRACGLFQSRAPVTVTLTGMMKVMPMPPTIGALGLLLASLGAPFSLQVATAGTRSRRSRSDHAARWNSLTPCRPPSKPPSTN
jgi:hypothetical protein